MNQQALMSAAEEFSRQRKSTKNIEATEAIVKAYFDHLPPPNAEKEFMEHFSKEHFSLMAIDDVVQQGRIIFRMASAALAQALHLHKISLADKLINNARNEWLAENDPKDGTDVVTPYDEWYY